MEEQKAIGNWKDLLEIRPLEMGRNVMDLVLFLLLSYKIKNVLTLTNNFLCELYITNCGKESFFV